MLISYLRYRYVKNRMTAYLDGELPVKTRRFIARQIDENSLCYREYIRAKQSRQELERSLPVFGKAENGQLDNIWANIQAELNQPESKSAPVMMRPRYSLSYGVAMLIFAVIMLTPFAIDVSRSGESPVPQHPLPEQAVNRTSPASTPGAETRAIAFAVNSDVQTETQATNRATIPLQNTPEARATGQ